jgi:hypothetical protein
MWNTQRLRACTGNAMPAEAANAAAAPSVHQRMPVEPAFATGAESAEREVASGQPWPALLHRCGIEQHDIGAHRRLQGPVAAQRGLAVRAGQEQIAAFAEGQIRPFTADRQQLVRLAHELRAEERHLDVHRRAELVADRGHRARRRATRITRVGLDHEHRAGKALVRGEEAGNGTARHRAADNDDGGPLVTFVHAAIIAAACGAWRRSTIVRR